MDDSLKVLGPEASGEGKHIGGFQQQATKRCLEQTSIKLSKELEKYTPLSNLREAVPT